VLRRERKYLAGVNHRWDGDAADGVGHDVGLYACRHKRGLQGDGVFNKPLGPENPTFSRLLAGIVCSG
jgi:hypothetical protein